MGGVGPRQLFGIPAVWQKDEAILAKSGVRSLALQAKEAGAPKQEILETITVVHYICGAPAVLRHLR
jgi:alkylhydroperoxidase/carboxymuconolactone decarboxylase family protein YurZ